MLDLLFILGVLLIVVTVFAVWLAMSCTDAKQLMNGWRKDADVWKAGLANNALTIRKRASGPPPPR